MKRDIGRVKRRLEYIEGTEVVERFQKAMKRILAVSHAEVQRRIGEHRKASEANPERRGPKRKANRAKAKERAH